MKSMLESALPWFLCAAAGATLAILELVQTFGKWMGRYWLNRYVCAILALNIMSACVVYAFLRYVMGVTSAWWLPIITGLTFPAILRSRFSWYRPLGAQKSLDTEGFSLAVDRWYRTLQNLCYVEMNSRIAADRRILLDRIRRRFPEDELKKLLKDHIVSGLLPDVAAEQSAKLRDIEKITDPEERHRRLAVLMMEIMPEQSVKRLLEARK